MVTSSLSLTRTQDQIDHGDEGGEEAQDDRKVVERAYLHTQNPKLKPLNPKLINPKLLNPPQSSIRPTTEHKRCQSKPRHQEDRLAEGVDEVDQRLSAKLCAIEWSLGGDGRLSTAWLNSNLL